MMQTNEMTLETAIKALEDFFFQFAFYAWGSYEGDLTDQAKKALDFLRNELLNGNSPSEEQSADASSACVD
jgi:hypothetical protein